MNYVYKGASNRSARYLGTLSDTAIYLGKQHLFPTRTMPTYIGSTPFVSGTGAISPTFASTGRLTGDLLILVVESANQAVTTPAGWTQFSVSPQSLGTAAAAGAVRITSFCKFSNGAETTISIADSGDHTTAAGIVVRGVDPLTLGNLLSNSNDLDNTTYWGKASTTVTRTGTSGDGINTANRVVMSSGAASGGPYIAPVTFNIAPSTTYTFTGYCRATSGTPTFGIGTYFSSSGTDTNISANEPTTTTIRRFSVTFTSGSATDLSIYLCNGTAGSGFDIEFSALQLWTGSTAIGYIPSTTVPVSNYYCINAIAGKTQAATTSVSFSTLTTTIDNCFVVNMLANDRDITGTGNLTSITNSSLSSITSQVDATNVVGQGGGVAIITGGKAAAGDISATTATNGASVTNASITIALSGVPVDTSDTGPTPDPTDVVYNKTINASSRTYSNSDRTMLNANTSYLPVFTTNTFTGKIYVELTLDSLGSGEDGITLGVCTVTTITSMYIGNTNKNINMFMCRPDDSNPGAPVVGTGIADNRNYTSHVMADGDVMQVAYDSTAHTVMFNINNIGWTSTYSTSAMSTTSLYIVAMAGMVGTQLTLNGGSSTFTFPPPSGYVGPEA